jgi:hypothetical protein
VSTSALKIIRHSLALRVIICLSFLIWVISAYIYHMYLALICVSLPSGLIVSLPIPTSHYLSSHFVCVPAISGIARYQTHYYPQTNSPIFPETTRLSFIPGALITSYRIQHSFHARPTARLRGI